MSNWIRVVMCQEKHSHWAGTVYQVDMDEAHTWLIIHLPEILCPGKD